MSLGSVHMRCGGIGLSTFFRTVRELATRLLLQPGSAPFVAVTSLQTVLVSTAATEVSVSSVLRPTGDTGLCIVGSTDPDLGCPNGWILEPFLL